MVRIFASLIMTACFGMSGCVLGYGRCLFTEPVKNTLVGRLHFRDYPAANGNGVDNVPVLALDSTAYIYSPAHSKQCLPANDVQLVGLAEFPREIIEGSHVTVDGSLFEAASAHEHTAFLINVTNILPLRTPH